MHGLPWEVSGAVWRTRLPHPQPVLPRRKDETAYYRTLRRVLLGPMMTDISAGVTITLTPL